MSNANPGEANSQADGVSQSGSRWKPPVKIIGQPTGQENAIPPLRLVALPGSRVVEIHKPDVLIGRQAEVDFQLLQPDVSRKHCRIFFADDHWQAEDLGSLNGTLVNGARIDCVPLCQNDMLRVASHLFRVELENAITLPLVTPDDDPKRTHSILRSIATSLPFENEQPERRRKSA